MLDAWIRRMTSAKVLMGDAEALRAELSTWMELLDQVRRGESWAESELMRLVSFHARNLGAEGHPASAAMMQVVLLEEVFEEAGLRDATRRITLQMKRLVVDAHGVGVAQRLTAKHRAEIARTSPVIRIGERAIVGFLSGPMHADILDSLFGRVLRECARTGAHVAVIDTLGMNTDDELFYRTIQGMQRMPPGDKLRLILTGLADTEATRKGLLRFGVNLDKVVFNADVSEVIAELH
jgi:hypothetical protein